MKTQKLIVSIAGLILAGVMSSAQTVVADEALAQKKGCLACHKIDAKHIGPGFKEVAAKYKGDDGAVAALANKVIKGSSGVWGTIPMPPNSAINEEEATTLVTWILQQ